MRERSLLRMNILKSCIVYILIGSIAAVSSLTTAAAEDIHREYYGYLEDIDITSYEYNRVTVSNEEQEFNNAIVISNVVDAVKITENAEAVLRKSFILGSIQNDENCKGTVIRSTIESDSNSVINDASDFYLYAAKIVADKGMGVVVKENAYLGVYSSLISATDASVMTFAGGDVHIGNSTDAINSINTYGQSAYVKLNESDKAGYEENSIRSVLEGGRNAIVVEGSNSEKPASLNVVNSHLVTDLSIGINDGSNGAKSAYAAHTAGSTVLLKSADAEVNLDHCSIEADKNGTGNIIHTVINDPQNDIRGESDSKGINIRISYGDFKGNIVHEDYRRDMYISMDNATFTGAVNRYSLQDWNSTWEEAGYSEFIIDESYDTKHILALELNNSMWTVSGYSRLDYLALGAASGINGDIYIDGMQVQAEAGAIYEGNIEVFPMEGYIEETDETTSENEGSHVHTWIKAGEGKTATCAEEGYRNYVCIKCREEYQETLPSGNHDMEVISESDSTCSVPGTITYRCSVCQTEETENKPLSAHDMKLVSETDSTCSVPGQIVYQCNVCQIKESSSKPLTSHNLVYKNSVNGSCVQEGYDVYVCSVCNHQEYTNYTPATGHNWVISYETNSTCSVQGQIVYECTRCSESETTYKAAAGHNFVLSGSVSATCTTAGYDIYTCSICGYTENDYWAGGAPGHSFYGVTPYYASGQQATYHINYCVVCGELQYGSESFHSGSPCVVCGY